MDKSNEHRCSVMSPHLSVWKVVTQKSSTTSDCVISWATSETGIFLHAATNLALP